MTPDGDSGEPTFVISDRAVESMFTCLFALPFVLFLSNTTKYIKLYCICVFELALGEVKQLFEFTKTICCIDIECALECRSMLNQTYHI